MPAGCVYFVSFYITGYPRDLDSIYFLLTLRLECTRPIFDVGGRIFSGRNDRWIFLYSCSCSAPSSLSLFVSLALVLLFPALLRRELLLRLTATSGSIQPRIMSQNNTKFDLVVLQNYGEFCILPFHFYVRKLSFLFYLFYLIFLFDYILLIYISNTYTHLLNQFLYFKK